MVRADPSGVMNLFSSLMPLRTRDAARMSCPPLEPVPPTKPPLRCGEWHAVVTAHAADTAASVAIETFGGETRTGQFSTVSRCLVRCALPPASSVTLRNLPPLTFTFTFTLPLHRALHLSLFLPRPLLLHLPLYLVRHTRLILHPCRLHLTLPFGST